MTMIKEVRGLAMTGDSFQIKPAAITVCFTSDTKGKTLSLSLDGEILLMIPFEEIKDMIMEDEGK